MLRKSVARQKTVRLICWNEADAAKRAVALQDAGYRVYAEPPESGGDMIRYFRELDPDVIVIDLDRLPSYGRELALGLRASRSTCHFPILFAGGVPAKIASVQSALPDADFIAWSSDLAAAIERVMRLPAAPQLSSRELPKPAGPGASWISNRRPTLRSFHRAAPATHSASC